MRPRSIQLRLAVWFTAAMAIVLGAFAAGTWLYLARTADERADRSADRPIGFLYAARTTSQHGACQDEG